jgi:hypothetical protein
MRRYRDRCQCAGDPEPAGAIHRTYRRRRAHSLGWGTVQRRKPGFWADYGDFADQAHFGWVTTAWRAVVAPNHDLFIGFLVGVLILSGGRKTQLGLIGAIGFHLALWLFGWGVSVYSLLMLPALALLLRAERRAGTISATSTAPASVARIEVTSQKS